MIDIDKKIRKGLPAQRDPAALQTTQDILIPAGTILRTTGDDNFSCDIGMNSIVVHGVLSIALKPHEPCPPSLKRVVAA